MTDSVCRNPSILVYWSAADDALETISRRFPAATVTLCRHKDDFAPLLAKFQPQVVLSVDKLKPRARRELLEATSVRWLQAANTGVDHLAPWLAEQLTVTNSPVHGEVLAEYAIAAILAMSLGLPRFAAQQRQRIWQSHSLPTVRGRTLAIVGLGRIGQGTGSRAKALGMRVLGLRMSPEPSPAADDVRSIERLHETLGEADFVVLTLPLTPRSRGMIDAAAIASIKPGAGLVNIARGGIVDEPSLLAALATGQIAAAYLDVFAIEPLPSESPFWSMDNVAITPHTGDRENWQAAAIDLFCDNLARWTAGMPLHNVTDPERGY